MSDKSSPDSEFAALKAAAQPGGRGFTTDEELIAILDNPLVAIVTFDENNNIRQFNRGAERIFGYLAEDVLETEAARLLWVPGEGLSRETASSRAYWSETLARGESLEVMGRRRGGESFPMEISVTVAEMGDELRFVLMALDLTRFKSTEENLRKSEANYRTLMEQASDGIIVCNPDGTIVDANDSACVLTGITRTALIGLKIDSFWQAGDSHPLLDDIAPGDTFRMEVELARPDAPPVPVELSGKLLEDGRLQAILREISERKRIEDELRFHATMDNLTLSYNRRYFLILADREFRRCLRLQRPIAAMMLDLDHFKAINDTHGHAAGDLVLRAVADSAKSNLREIDLFGRFGGEEFAVILPETDLETALVIAERLRAGVEAVRVVSEADEIRVTVSVGVTESKGGAADVASLLKRADRALYAAKASGRNRVEAQTGLVS